MPRFNSIGTFDLFLGPLGGSEEDEYNGANMVFVQTAAPTGWVKTTTFNDYALRVTSGTASNGGSVGFSTAFANLSFSMSPFSITSVAVNPFTMTSAETPAHTHTYSRNQPTTIDFPNLAPLTPATLIAAPATLGPGIQFNPNPAPGGFAHGHSSSGPFTGTFTAGGTLDMAVRYVDVILASYTKP